MFYRDTQRTGFLQSSVRPCASAIADLPRTKRPSQDLFQEAVSSVSVLFAFTNARCRSPALHAHRCACAEPVSARRMGPPVCSATEQTGGSQTPLRDCRASRLTSTRAGSPRPRSRRCRSSMRRSRRRSRCTHVGFGRPSQPRTRACRFHAERLAPSLHTGPAASPDHVLQLGGGFLSSCGMSRAQRGRAVLSGSRWCAPWLFCMRRWW